MQTTHKIAGGDTEGYATYLTLNSERGDYYVDPQDENGEGAAGGLGLTTTNGLALIGGRQTDREHAYVTLTRAREQTNIYVSKENLGSQGINADAIERLAEKIEQSKAQQASITNEPVANRSLSQTAEPKAETARDLEPGQSIEAGRRPDHHVQGGLGPAGL